MYTSFAQNNTLVVIQYKYLTQKKPYNLQGKVWMIIEEFSSTLTLANQKILSAYLTWTIMKFR